MRTKLEQAAYEYREAVKAHEKHIAEKREKVIAALTIVEGAGYFAEKEAAKRGLESALYGLKQKIWDEQIDKAMRALCEAAMKEQD